MTLDTLIQNILKETDYRNNPYFLNLDNGQFDKSDFVETQIQFYYAVIFFSRPMAALAGKIPSPELRLEVLRNVWEEHGEGNLSHGHGGTFLELLKRLGGITPEQVFSRGLWPEIRIFNTTLTGATVLDDFLVGVGTMGIIERMFSDISAWIGQGILKRGWLQQENMIHYHLHEKLDIRHSQDFFDILQRAWAISDENRYQIEQGLRLGATLFNGLYAGLWQSRKKRWLVSPQVAALRTSDYRA
jgi:pyrroloquinoline quinone (PQQ) biosynthesis protein C